MQPVLAKLSATNGNHPLMLCVHIDENMLSVIRSMHLVNEEIKEDVGLEHQAKAPMEGEVETSHPVKPGQTVSG